MTPITNSLKTRWDGFINLFTSLGSNRDKAEQSVIAKPIELDFDELEWFYDGSATAAKIVDKFVEEMLRAGFVIMVDPDGDDPKAGLEQGQDIHSALYDLGIMSCIRDAMRRERVFGGAVVWLIVDDGALDQAMPLNMEGIKEIVGCQVFDARDVQAEVLDSDELSPTYGEPIAYRIDPTSESKGSATVSSAGTIVHASRLIVFPGLPRMSKDTGVRNGWGGSVLERVYTEIRDYSTAWQSVTHLTHDAPQGIYYLENLFGLIAAGDEKTIRRRLMLTNEQRSVADAIIMDASERFERQPHQLGGLENILREFAVRLASAVDMPVTALFGVSPAGMNATGESDLQLWHSTVSSRQEEYLEPRIDQAVRIVTAAKDGPTKGKVPEDWRIQFNPLKQMSEMEQADLRLKVAQADQIWITHDVLLSEEIGLSRFRPTGFSMETEPNQELRDDLLSDAIERAKQPPPDENESPDPEAGEPLADDAPGGGEESETQNAPPAAEPAQPSQAVDPKTALNGAQVTAMLGIVENVANRVIPRETGVRMMVAAFPVDDAQAQAIMGEVGNTFFFQAEAPAPIPGAGPPPPPPVEDDDAQPEEPDQQETES